MASKGYVISVATDSRLFEQGVRMGIIKPVEEADDALTDLGKNRGADRLEGDIKAAQKATAGLNREIEETSDSIRAAQRQSRKLGDDTGDSFHQASRNVEEFKDEARQNFSEVVSSFDGSMDSVADLAQGTLGGLAGSIAGPVGLAAGAGAAILGGMFTAMTTAATEEAEKTEQRVSDMVDDMLESGQRFASETLIQDTMKEIVKDAGQLDDVERRANIAGVSIQTALRAQAGDKDAIAAAIEAAQRSLDGLIASGESMSSVGVRETQKVIDGYKALQGDISTAAGRVDLLTQASSNSAAAIQGAVGAASALKGQLDSFHDINVKVNFDDARAQEIRRQLGKEIRVDIVATPRVGKVVY